MASITKRGNKWQARISWREHGSLKQKSKSGFTTKREATVWATEQENTLNSGGSIVNSGTPFPDYFWQWYLDFKENNVTERTSKTYEYAHKQLIQFLNDPIGNIDRKRYRTFMRDFGSRLAKSSVSKYNSLYHACVKEALYEGDVQRDFIDGVQIVYDKSRTMKVDYLAVSDMETLCNHLLNTRNRHYTSKYMIYTALLTGARLGELQALTWDDINPQFKTISINKAWYEPARRFKSTKNESSKRIIRVNQQLINVLSELRGKDMVFANQFNTIPTSAAVNKTLRECLHECGINKQGFHFHSLRHTHVAYLLYRGMDIYAISKRLGHSDVTTTSRVYSYLIDEYKNQTDNLVEGYLDSLCATSVQQNSENIRKHMIH